MDILVEWLESYGFVVTKSEEYPHTLFIWDGDTSILNIKWTPQENAWIPWFAGPAVKVKIDFEHVINSAIANMETLVHAKKTWEEYFYAQSEKNWMIYIGSQCPFYQRANLWGKVLDDMEELKRLALEAANLLQKKQLPFTKARRINQEIYKLLEKLGFPTEEEIETDN